MMNTPDLASERKDYRRGHLLESDTPAGPFPLFAHWMEEAFAQVEEATAMALATSEDNRPSC
ncbi:pyridoxamine 5'-phosphate oxidase, partial [Salmonella enterica]